MSETGLGRRRGGGFIKCPSVGYCPYSSPVSVEFMVHLDIVGNYSRTSISERVSCVGGV